jgi:hypothetical protein
MQEPDNSTGLFEDRLTDAIKEYVFSLLPETEQNSGLAVDVFTLRRKSEPIFFDDSEHHVNDVKGYCIATLTDKTLRLHHLDNWWELAPAGYRYYDRARKEGRHRILRSYDTLIERHGHLYCHLPNEIALLEIRRKDILTVSVSTCTADEPVLFNVKDNLMLDIEDYVSVEVRTRDRVQRFCSIFSGINTLVEQLKFE